MILTERTINIIDHESIMDSPVVLYRGDKNVELKLNIKSSRFKFRDDDSSNFIESAQASYGQLIIQTPNQNEPIFSEITATKKGYIIFVITAEMIDEIDEVGAYTFQVRLLDSNKRSRATIPPVVNGIEIREPITSEDSNVLNSAVVGLASAANEEVLDTFDEHGDYAKTNWKFGDKITAAKLNKAEDGIYQSYALGLNNSSQIRLKANKSEINSLETRLSNIIAHNGDGTKDTEIVDARGNFSTLGERLTGMDSNGYIMNNYIKTGDPRYINSWSIGKGWGTVFSADKTEDISQVIIRKSKVNGESVKVTTDITLTLFECDGTDIGSIRNAVVLETVTISSSIWNEYKEDSDIIWKLNTNYIVNSNKYYGVTVYSTDKVNCAQIGYNRNNGETNKDGFKSDSFKTGIWINVDPNTLSNYIEVSGNTYALYVAVKGSNSSMNIKIKTEQIEDFDEKIGNMNIPLKSLPFLNEYIAVGHSINTGSKSLLYDKVSGWATVIKGANFEIDKIILNKTKISNIRSDITFNFYESDTEDDWIKGNIILTKTMSPTKYNEIVGDFELQLNSPHSCKKDKFYTVQVICNDMYLCLAQSGQNAVGRSDVSEYFVNAYYYSNSKWNHVSNNYGLFVELRETGMLVLPKIKKGQVEGLIEDLEKIIEENSKPNTQPNTQNKGEYIDIYRDTFKENTNWIGTTSNWSFNGELVPTSKGDTNTNSIKLNKPYHGDKRIMRFDTILYSDTVLDINMTRTTNNSGEGESIYQIDIPNNRIIMFAANGSSRGVDKSNILKYASINFNIIDGNKYLVEVEKNDFTYYFRIKDYLTANITEIELKGWGAGRQNHFYGFSWIAGNNAPKISNFKISMLNKPKCVFVGDSITEGVGMSSINENESNNYTKRYAEIIRNTIGDSMISAMGGDTIDTIIRKFDSAYTHIKPKAISVTIGTNGGVSVNTLAKFKTLIDNAYSINAKLIINLVPCGSSGNYLGVNELLLTLKQDEAYKDKFILGCQFDVATAKDYYPYVDENHPTTITGKTTRVDSSLTVDHKHPNAKGSIRMANRYSIDVPEIFNL